MNSIQSALVGVLPARRKQASKGWISFDAKCCTHNGESADKRGRGGLLLTPEGGFSYHCFNCQYKASWKPGYHLNYKTRNLLSWMGMPSEQIQVLVFEAMRDVDRSVVAEELKKKAASFTPKDLPAMAGLADLVAAGADLEDENLARAVTYLTDRGFTLDDYDWQWSPETEHGLNRRVIIPYTWQGQTIGYTARSTSPTSKLKYFNQIDSDYVFNVDAQTPERQFVLVTEGPLDAIAVGGVGVLTNDISPAKADIIDSLGRQVIVVPDRDRSGARLVELAIEWGWGVAFPDWQADVKDAAAAYQRYGRLYTIRSILAGTETSALKIKLRSRGTFN